MKNKLAFGITLITLAGLILSLGLFSTKSANSQGLPSYALKDSRVKEAYLFATKNPEALTNVNCHCGCMKNLHGDEKRIHTRGLIDCFFDENNNYDSHASECNVCINDALQAKQLTLEGKTKEEINQIIDENYKF